MMIVNDKKCCKTGYSIYSYTKYPMKIKFSFISLFRRTAKECLDVGDAFSVFFSKLKWLSKN